MHILVCRNQRGAQEIDFILSVSSGQCPHPAENRAFKQGTTDVLLCKQMDILKLQKNTTHVRWLKVVAQLILSND